ncbi:DUF6892 domain-containing protein [Streptomyces sp. NPDC059076]|uniref:DUF6892 domain-containing protein n=1 Tax=unclassified Streptomyces TaxID=2593676 RepID=UPI0036AEB074
MFAGVESLCFDAGLEIYRHCAPAWDGEDGLFDVRSLNDLDLLPQLKRGRGRRHHHHAGQVGDPRRPR